MSAIIRPCPTHVKGCPCINDNPFANLSSEAPDPADVIQMAYVAADPGINSTETFWDTPIGLGSCSAPTSQEALDCAAFEAYQDTHLDQPLFRSRAMVCSVPCPDGTSFSYSLPAGAITAATQVLADYLASTVCQYRAALARRCAPTVVTLDATDLEADPDHSGKVAAKLNGTVNPNGSSTTAFFEWGTTTSYGNITPITDVGAGAGTLNFSANIANLISGTTYHFRIVAISAQGTSFGADKSFMKSLISLEEFDFNTYHDLTEAGAVCGIETTGFGAAFFQDDNVTTIAAGVCRCGNAASQYGGQLASGNAFWNDESLLVLRDFGFGGNVFSMAEDGFSAVQDVANISYLYDPYTGVAGTFTALGDLGGGQTSIGAIGLGTTGEFNRAINSSHQIACTSRDGGFFINACRWSAGVLTQITPVFATPNNDNGSIGIDETGAILGYYQTGGVVRGFINLGGGAINSVDIGFFGGYVFPFNISKHNRYATGYARSGGQDRAFAFKNGSAIRLIPLLSGEISSYGLDANSDGWMVGYSFGATDTKVWLYKWDTNTTVDLLTLFPAGHDFTDLFDVKFVNDAHQIAGQGNTISGGKFFLLTLA